MEQNESNSDARPSRTRGFGQRDTSSQPPHFLVGLDIQQQNDDAVHEALAFATLFPRTRVTVAWVVPATYIPPQASGLPVNAPVPSPEELLRDRVAQSVADFGQERLTDSQSEVSLILGEGKAAQSLERIAFLNEVDMVFVAGSDRKKSALESFFLGSVAEELVKTAPCPVLVSRPRLTEAVPRVEEPDPAAHAKRRLGIPNPTGGASGGRSTGENMPLVFPM